MSTAQNGATVRVSYIGTLSDGTVFDRTDDQTLDFTIGSGQLIPGFESAVIGMQVGETRKVTIAPDQAYGEYDESRVVEVTRSRLPDNFEPQIGQVLQAQSADGEPVLVTVTDLSKGTVTLDGNHALAGKELTFEIVLQEIL